MPSPSWLPLEDPAAEVLETNWLFELRREPYRSRHSGQVHHYYVIHLADAVNVIALTPDRKLVMVRQFRAGANQDSLETPGGLVDEGEDVLSAAARELREETGYEGNPPVLLGMSWSNPSILSSRIATVLITGAKRSAIPSLDAEEEVEVELVSAGRVPVMIRDGRINHALVVQGLLLWLVSEIPDQPLTVEPPDPSPWQFRIGNLLVWIALIAVVFGVLANLGKFAVIGVSWVFSVATIVWIRYYDPERKCVLLRWRKLRGRPLVLNTLAWVGALVLWIGLAIVAFNLF
ncbi:MAG TPA: NUDIX hydrolase [Isosphaeraceae bacterium]|nr:NUDIX hydrolase [Isosphaeraceae bacterium]